MDKHMETFASTNRPLGEVTSEVIQSDTSNEIPTDEESFTTAQTNIETTEKRDTSVNGPL